MKCNICDCEHKNLVRTGILHLRGSEDDFICAICRLELSKFAMSLQVVASKVRWEEIDKYKGK